MNVIAATSDIERASFCEIAVLRKGDVAVLDFVYSISGLDMTRRTTTFSLGGGAA